MSSLALFRPTPPYEDLRQLAEEHIRHDLPPEDRDTLRNASSRVSRHAAIGTLLGLGLGVYTAVRLRRVRAGVFNALRTAEKPSQVVFRDGRVEPIPDLTPFLQPTQWGDYAAYFFFGLGGLFLGGEFGLLTGTWSATRMITRDPARRERIENAYRKFRIDCLKREINRLESGHSLFP
ncbi:hypothetical protein VTK73DRAFT_2037 [Phialemonium thermophilum]|uniref:Transmembrane protein n=1 Tax=Phialemonium thermophilum TaxID=223376 RepID=A0ABR3X7D7_9PEZI